MKLIILDTNVLSELRRPHPHPNVLSWLAGRASGEIVVSAPSIAEIARGIALVARSDPAKARLIATWLDRILVTQSVLPLDGPAARVFGEMTCAPGLDDLAGRQQGADLAIAAIALANDAAVATRNVRDFGRIACNYPALRVIDPFRSPDDPSGPAG